MKAKLPVNHKDLAERFNSGDENAFKIIYDEFWPKLFGHARRMLRDDDQAADVVQDVFMSFLKARGSLPVNYNILQFLSLATRNAVLNLIRHEKVATHYLNELMDFSEEDYYSTDSMVLERELMAQIEAEIALLPEKMREIFLLSRFKHMSYQEIARTVGVTEGTVKKQVYYALKILKERLLLVGLVLEILLLKR